MIRYLFMGLILLSTLVLSAKEARLEQVSLQLQWLDQFQFAGYYMAKEKGFYNDVGLDVECKKFDLAISPLDEVLNKRATYAISRSSLLIDKSKGKDIKLISATFQSSPYILLATKKSKIDSVKAFKNRKIMLTDDASQAVSVLAMINQQNIALEDMIRVDHSFNIDDLIDAKVDLMASYLSNEPYLLQERGIGYTVFDPKDYGFDFYSDILFTSSEEVSHHPQRTKNFKEASLKGWEYAFNHIDESVDVILEKYNTQHKSREALLYEAKVLKKLAYYKTEKLGNIDQHKIQRIYDLYNLMGLIKNEIDLKELVFDSTSNQVHFTQKEKKYLQDKKVITMCIDPSWMPFEKLEHTKHIGMTADYFKLFKERVGIDINVIPTTSWQESIELAKKRECDILSLVMKTKEREKYLNFTDAYLKVPLVIATKLDVPFINDLSQLTNEKVGITKGYAFVEILKERYPDLQIIEVNNITEGLEKVNQGELFGYIGTLASIGYMFQTQFTGELKIAGKFFENWELGIGVRNDDEVLLGILQKVVKSVDAPTRQAILNKWIAVKYEKIIDYDLILNLMIFLGVVVSFFIYRQYILSNVNRELKSAVKRRTKELKELNENLESKILERTKELEKLASIDPLSQLYNRRYFTQMSAQIFELARRDRSNISIIMLDIDDFKKINDTYGHKIGDEVIVILSRILQKYTRKSDVVCRFGGEEFIVLLPETSMEGALVIAQKIREVVESKELSFDEKTVNFTISVGVAQVDIIREKSVEPAIQRADKAMYAAKHTGKNRVCTKSR